MRLKLLGLAAAVALLAACSSDQDAAGTGSVTGATSATAPTTNAGAVRPGTRQDFEVNVGDRVFFGFDQYDLSPEARSTLDRQAQWLNQYRAVTIQVEGHADERGTREYNLALGERRANAVKNYLVARGVDPNRVGVISYGKERPAVLGSNEAAWAQNRRGVTVVQ
ncbi:peptidoglycan-associated lipoprotein Pal [Arenibaculum pallidiluteum]|uniref:peptidoglycan-associated lipoprotein Pal n=1 Tax=Arenibaculum pallidiluteum TaxID=2812559 RepID=UPI001A97B359|nr:peptidoglycan-associated lipoprotein Pal [Arenibaculum pallidiluteum]